jgi:uncharacterized Ntn-hydrolase superfamily protein
MFYLQKEPKIFLFTFAKGQEMTFSIIALDKNTKELGVCTSTGAHPAIGSAVTHVKENVAGIVTQAITNPSYGIVGLKLIELGFTPAIALESMLEKDKRRESRQVAIIDIRGRIAAHTGDKVPGVKGHIVRNGFAVCGNILTDMSVLEKMAGAYESAHKELPLRLLAALTAAKNAGGDTEKTGPSAALLVKKVPSYSPIRPNIDLRVDLDDNPVQKLSELYHSYAKRLGLYSNS